MRVERLAAYTEEELGYQNDASEWTVRGSEDFLVDVEEDKRHVAAGEVRRVAAAHEDAAGRRMAYYSETFGGGLGTWWVPRPGARRLVSGRGSST